jgi:DNA-binding MarR family transcriptional regulator
MAATRAARHATPPPGHGVESAALRFLLRTGRFGESISAGMAARVGDREHIGNLTVIIIADLCLAGARRPVELQETTGLSSGGVTKALDRLESAGLIGRTHGAVGGDRRAIVVGLTDEGRRVAGLLAAGLLDTIDDTRATLRDLTAEADELAAAAGRSP